MKILYDLQAVQPDNAGSIFHGGGEYARFFFEKAIELGYAKRCQVEVCINKKKYIDPKLLTLCHSQNIPIHDTNEINNFSEFLNLNEYDIFYSALPYKGYEDLKSNNTKLIYTVHGLRVLEMPYDFFETKYSKKIKNIFTFLFKIFFKKTYYKLKKKEIEKILSANIIFTDSLHSKYSMLNHFQNNSLNNIKVFYAPIINKPIQEIPDEKCATLSKHQVNSKEYFLIISANRWIKNAYRAILAFDQLFDKKLVNKKVLVLGIADNLFKIKNTAFFSFSGYVDPRELEILYKNAFALLYPSLNEGFGYPPIEAMKYKTPVLASAISAIPEICQNSVLYFNPYSVDEMQNRIITLLNEPIIYQTLSQKGYNRYLELINDQEAAVREQLDIIFPGIREK